MQDLDAIASRKMLLNDTENTLKTESSKHNPFSNKSQIHTVTYREKK